MNSKSIAVLAPPSGAGGNENLGDQLILTGLLRHCPADEVLLLNSEDEAAFAYNLERAREIGTIVVAGQPQYHVYDSVLNTHWTKHKLYVEYFRDQTIWVVGGGSQFPPDYELAGNPYAMSVYRDRITNVKHVVRDEPAAGLLSTLGADVRYLPCPSLLAAEALSITPAAKPSLGLIVLPRLHYVESQDSGPELLLKLQRQVTSVALSYTASGLQPLIVAHSIADTQLAKKLLPTVRCYYSNNLKCTLGIYRQAALVTAWRVHGALAAYQASNAKVVHVGIDSRSCTLDRIPGIQNFTLNTHPADISASFANPETSRNAAFIKQTSESYAKLWKEILP